MDPDPAGSPAPQPAPAARAPSTAADRRARRSRQTAEAILGAAEALFLERGYDAVRVEDVAARADVGVGSLYVHAGSKRGLYVLVVQRALDRLEGYVSQAYRAGLSPWLQVLASAELYLAFVLDHPGYHRLIAFPPFASEADAAAALQPYSDQVDAMIARLAAAVDAAAAEGFLSTADPLATATVLWGTWSGVLAHLTRPDRGAVPAETLAALMALTRKICAEGLATPRLRDRSGRLRAEHDVPGTAAPAAGR